MIKNINTVLLSISILSPCVLWFTKSDWLPSLSAFALSSNALWYRLMHLSASWFMVLNYKSSWHNLVIGFGMGLILIFDMYAFPVVHNIVTLATMLFACFSLIYNAKGFEKGLAIFLSFCAILYFFIGYFNATFHFLLAEIVALFCLMTGKFREFYLIKKKILL